MIPSLEKRDESVLDMKNHSTSKLLLHHSPARNACEHHHGSFPPANNYTTPKIMTVYKDDLSSGQNIPSPYNMVVSEDILTNDPTMKGLCER